MKYTVIFICLLFELTDLFAQKKENFQIVWYNVENLFDTIDDPHKTDNEYLPGSSKQWNTQKYTTKLNHISEVITASKNKEFPELVGLCEVENISVLKDLVNQKSLKKAKYKIVHYESPDRRGIDVALLYNSKEFKPLYTKNIPVRLPDNNHFKTRDILYVKGLLLNKDTLHVFLNHWPSRMGGKEKSEVKRLKASEILKHHLDSLTNIHQNNIVVMGDFNDTPADSSLQLLVSNPSFFNVFMEFPIKGTHNYKGEWNTLDQFIITKEMKNKNNGIYFVSSGALIFDFLFYETKKGEKYPNRTYNGEKYYGGYSDHLPVYLKLKVK